MYKVDDLTLIKLLMTEAPNLPSIPLQEGPKEEPKKPFELTNDMAQFLQNAFDSMNRDCIFFEPKMIQNNS